MGSNQRYDKQFWRYGIFDEKKINGVWERKYKEIQELYKNLDNKNGEKKNQRIKQLRHIRIMSEEMIVKKTLDKIMLGNRGMKRP